MEGTLEQIVSVVNCVGLHLTLSCQCVESIPHEKGDVDRLVDRLKGTSGFSLEEHILDVGGGRVNERVLLVEATRLDFAGFSLLVNHGQLAVKHVDAILGDHNASSELGVPENASYI